MEKKRERDINFSYEEIQLLIDLVLKYKHIIENKNMSAIIWNAKKNAWRNITEEFNVNSKYKRSMRSLKMKYEAMKTFLKKKFINNEKYNSTSSLPLYAPADLHSSIISFPDQENKEVNKNRDNGAIVEEVNNNVTHNIKLEMPDMEPETTISDTHLDVTYVSTDLKTIDNTLLGTEQISDAAEDSDHGPIRTPKRFKSMRNNYCYNLKEKLSVLQIKSLQYDLNIRQKMDALRMKVLEVDLQIKQVELQLKERELIKNDSTNM